jgi:hypothetical protein
MALKPLTDAERNQFNSTSGPLVDPDDVVERLGDDLRATLSQKLEETLTPSGYAPTLVPKRPGFESEYEDTRTGPAAFRRAFQQENLISLLGGGAEDNRLADLYALTEAAGRKIDTNYNVEEDRRLQNLQPGEIAFFIHSNSFDHTTAMLAERRAQDRLERQDRQDSGATIAGTIAGAVLDPSLLLLPTVRGFTKLQSIRNASALLGTEEAVKQAIDNTRPDSYLGYALGAGTLVGVLSKSRQPLRTITDQEIQEIEARAVARLLDDEQQVTGARIEAAQARSAASVGARETPTGQVISDVDDVAMTRPAPAPGGLERLNMNPIMVLLNEQNPQLAAITQRVVLGALEIPFYLRGNMQKIALATPSENAETLLRSGRGAIVETTQDIRGNYNAYVQSQTGKQPGRFSVTLGRRPADDVLTYREFGREVTRALGDDLQHPIPQVSAAAKRVRQFYDDIWENGQKAGVWEGIAVKELRDINDAISRLAAITKSGRKLTPGQEKQMASLRNSKTRREAQIERIRTGNVGGKRKNYFNVVYRRDYWRQNKERMLEVIMREGGHERQVAEEIFDQITRSVPYRGNPFMRVAQERTLNIDPIKFMDDAAGDAIETDIFTLMRMYQRSTDADIGLYKNFGSLDLSDQIDAVREVFKTMPANAANKRKMEAMIQRIEAVRDLVRGTYGLPSDPANFTSRAIRMSKNYAALTLLTGPLAAAPDVTRAMMVNGISNTFRSSLEPLFNNVGQFKASKRILNAVGEAADMILASQAARVTDLGDYVGVFTGFERKLERGTNFYFNYINGMNMWTDTMKTLNGMVTQTQLLRGIEEIATKGKTSKKITARLAKLGIDAPMANRINAQNASWERTKHNIIGHTDKWTDDVARETFERAMGVDARFTIITPGLGDAPLFATDIRAIKGMPDWVSPEIGSLLFQFKKFGLSAHQKVLLAGLQGEKRDAVMGMVAMVGLGAIVDYVRSTQTNAPGYNTRSFTQKMYGAVERAGIVAPLLDVSNHAESLTHAMLGAPLGLKPILGIQQRYDPTMRQIIGNAVGPAAVPYVNLLDFLTTDSDMVEARRLRELAFANRLAHLDWFWDGVEQTLR